MNWVIHSDMNSFFVSVELLYKPELIGKAVAVAGRQADRHGIILAKTETAGKMGVKTGEPVWQAKSKCPNLILLEPNMQLYKRYSEMATEIYERYTYKVEKFGIDECWIDVTDREINSWNDVLTIAFKIKKDIFAELGLTVSIGVAHNKFLAKMGSSMAARDSVKAVDYLTLNDELHKLPLEQMFNCGQATVTELAKYNVKTIGDLANLKYDFCYSLMGKQGGKLWQNANGIDQSQVKPNCDEHLQLSISKGITLRKDVYSDKEVLRIIQRLLKETVSELHRNRVSTQKIELSLRYMDFTQKNINYNLPKPEDNYFNLQNYFNELLSEGERTDLYTGVRAITIGFKNLVIKKEIKSNAKVVYDDKHENRVEWLENTWGELAKKYGNKALFRASEATTYEFLSRNK